MAQQGTTEEGDTPQVDTQQTETVRAYVGSYHWGFFILDESGAELSQLTLSPGDELRLTLFNVEAEAAIDDLPQAVRTNIPSSDERAQRNEQAIPTPQGTNLQTLHDSAEAAYPDHGLAILRDDFFGTGPNYPGQQPGSPPGPGPGNPGQGPGGPGQQPGSGGPGRGPWGGHHGPHGPGGGRGGPYGPGSPGSPRGGYNGTLAPPVYLWHHSTVPNELGFVVNTSGSFGFACTVYCGYGHPYMAERSRIVVTEDDE